MKKLAALVVAVALAIAAAPGMTASEETQVQPNPEVIAMIEDVRGIDLSDWDYEVMAFEFELPPLTTGFTATFDWENMELDVQPGALFPRGGSSADCLTPAAEFLGSAPLACAPEVHGGPISSSTLVCAGGSFCALDALDYFLFAFWFADCQAPVLGSAGHPGWAPTVGTCFVFYDSFGLPGQFSQWDAIVGTAGGVAYGGHN